MKTTAIAGIVMVTCFAFSCSQGPENLSLGKPVTFENLTLYPVLANEPFHEARTKTGNYLTLKEAVDARKVTVTELESEEVNTLLIENTSGDTVLILNGETVEGGNQNRMIARDMVLPPHSGKVDVSVYCVEQGRWEAMGEFKVTKASLPPGDLRQGLSIEVPDQLEVWEDVDVKLREYTVSSSTSALHDIKMNESYEKRVSRYTEFLAGPLTADPKVIGVVAVVSDGSMTCDVFATPWLFRKHVDNLLQSYASQAMVAEESASPDVSAFWAKARSEMTRAGFLSSKGGKARNIPHFTLASASKETTNTQYE